MRLFFVVSAFFLAACASTPDISSETSNNIVSKLIPQPVFIDESYFGEPFQVIPVEQIFILSEAQEQDFINYFNSNKNNQLRPNRRIQEYLEIHLKKFNYFDDTFTATETLSRDSGNCLSLAILTNALAELSNVKVKHELVSTPPIYQRSRGIITGSQHIRTVLYDPPPKERNNLLSWRRGVIKIDYFSSFGDLPLRRVNKDEFHAMYYNNIAANSLIENNNKKAFFYLKKSLKTHKHDAQAINMMAILHSRLGFDEYAEKLYKHGIQYGEDKLELLKNFHTLLIRKQRFVEAIKIEQQLLEYDDPDPYKWMNIAEKELNNKNYSGAISYFRKAIKVADYLHEPYVGIAQAYYFMGNYRKAKKYLKSALEKTYKKSTKSLYLAKYKMLSELLNKG